MSRHVSCDELLTSHAQHGDQQERSPAHEILQEEAEQGGGQVAHTHQDSTVRGWGP